MASRKRADYDEIIEDRTVEPGNSVPTLTKYGKLRFLGKGGFAKVHEVVEIASGRLFAAKIVSKALFENPKAKEKLMSEIKIHRELSHPQIVGFERVFEDHMNVYIILELCDSGTLGDVLKRRGAFTEFEARYFAYQIISAIKHCHSKGIIHRDLKLGNVFLHRNLEVKIGDFGLAVQTERRDEVRKTVCGTPNYIAPEVISPGNEHSFGVDVWAFGVILWALIFGRPPFETKDIKQTYDKIRSANFSFPGTKISKELRDLFEKIFVVDPSKRFTVNEILCHPFLKAEEIPLQLSPKCLESAPSASLMKELLAQGRARKLSVMKTAPEPKSETRPRRAEALAPAAKPLPPKLARKDPTRPPEELRSVFVKRWVDFSEKYGCGYLLTNGDTGVLFNDGTIMAHLEASEQVYLLEKSETNKERRTCYFAKKFPESLRKKVELLNYFRSFLLSKQFDTPRGVESASEVPEKEQVEFILFVKNSTKTKNATVLRLSNRVFQLIFNDDTEIVLNNETQTVFYKDKKGAILDFPAATALSHSNTEMVKRLKYTVEIVKTVSQK